MSQQLRLVRVVTLAAALILPAAVVTTQKEAQLPAAESQPGAEQKDQKKQESDNKKDKEKGQKESRKLQVFQLKHSKPQEIMQLLSMAITSRPPAAGQSEAVEQPSDAAQDAGSAPLEDVRIAADDDSSLLFVRATQKYLDKVKELVAAFDTPTGDVQRKEFSGLLIVPLANENANRVLGILQQLDISVGTLSFGEKQLLMIDIQQTETAEQAKQILAAFDAKAKAAKPKDKTEPTKNE